MDPNILNLYPDLGFWPYLELDPDQGSDLNPQSRVINLKYQF